MILAHHSGVPQILGVVSRTRIQAPVVLTQSISDVMSGMSKVISSTDGQLFQICGGSSSGRDSGVISLGRLEAATWLVSLQVFRTIS